MGGEKYVIAGGGASGLLLAYRLAKDSFFDTQQITLIEKENKTENDRTWCFWEDSENEFEHLLTKTWKQFHISNSNGFSCLPTNPYTYKMLRSKAFYQHIHSFLKTKPNVEMIQDTVVSINEKETTVEVQLSNQTIKAAKVFTSIIDHQEIENTTTPLLYQHFVGWFIKTDHPAFDKEVATFMDFSVPQKGNTRFMYVLPISNSEALVEYTLFSKELLPDDAYNSAIKAYLEEQGITNYTITEKEKGCIPMTTHNFYKKNTKNVLHIGTTGGFTKPSTGFTFKNSQEKVAQIAEALKQKEINLNSLFKQDRFTKYDTILLELLAKENHKGAEIFSTMFEHNSVPSILKFLDEKTSTTEEVTIINSLPKTPFLKALIRSFKQVV